jgi:hypothetical protein
VKFSEIANRLTGISTPLVGVSWQPSDLEVSAARRVIAFLEDRKSLALVRKHIKTGGLGGRRSPNLRLLNSKLLNLSAPRSSPHLTLV